MTGDFSLSVTGNSSDIDAVKAAFQTFLASVRSAGTTNVTGGGFSSSQSIDVLDESLAPATDPAAPPEVTP